MQKPLARNATEAARIVTAFKEAGVPLYSAYYRRAQARPPALPVLTWRPGRLSQLLGVWIPNFFGSQEVG